LIVAIVPVLFGDHVFDRNDHRRSQFLNGEQVGNLDRFERARGRRGRSFDAALLLTLTLFFEQ
jgi:hypothetical protein